jgi:hypothetical protein
MGMAKSPTLQSAMASDMMKMLLTYGKGKMTSIVSSYFSSEQ